MITLPVLLLFLSSVSSSTPYKILVYNPKFGHSHSAFLGRIADVLVEAGHNVIQSTKSFLKTTLIPIMDRSVIDGTSQSRVIHVQADPQVASYYASSRKVNFFDMKLFNPVAPFFIGPLIGNLFGRTCKKVIDDPGLIDSLRAEQFDVYITENFDACGIGIAEAIKPKAVIGATSTCLWGWQFDEYGVEQAISYRPTLVSSSLDARSIIDRFWNGVGETLTRHTFSYLRTEVNRVLKNRFGEDYPTTWEQSATVAYILTNSESLIESAAPTSSRVINIPGVGATKPQPLDDYWEEVVNRRSKTALISFGTIAKSTQLSGASKRGILEAIARFPEVTFIWKYEDPDDEFGLNQASKLENLILTKWIPQVDLLSVFIPIFGDQPRNAGMMEFNELGLVYDKFELHDGEKLAGVIREVLVNRKYAENAKRLSKMLAKKPFSSRDLLIKHVEFAAEFGTSSALQPQSVDMTFIEYLNLDIIATLGVFNVFIILLVIKLAVHLVGFITVRKQKIH